MTRVGSWRERQRASQLPGVCAPVVLSDLGVDVGAHRGRHLHRHRETIADPPFEFADVDAAVDVDRVGVSGGVKVRAWRPSRTEW